MIIKKIADKMMLTIFAFLLAFSVTFSFSTKKVDAIAAVDDVAIVVLGFLATMGFVGVFSDGSKLGTSIDSPLGDSFIKQEIDDFKKDCVSSGIATSFAIAKWSEKLISGVVDTTTTVSKNIFDFFKKHLYNWANSNSDIGLPGITSLPLDVEILDGHGISLGAFNKPFSSTLKMTSISDSSAKAYLLPLWPAYSSSKTMFVVSTSKNCDVTLNFGSYSWTYKTTQSYGDTGLYYAPDINIGNTIFWSSSDSGFNLGTYILPLHREMENLNDYIKGVLENHDIDVENSFTNRKYLDDESIDGYGIADVTSGTYTDGHDEVRLGWLNNSFTKNYEDAVSGTLGIDDIISKNKSYVKDKDKTINDAVTIPDSIPFPIAIPDEDTISKTKNIKNSKSLITLFPFCIPYDLYYCFTLFCAEPAPLKFDFYYMQPVSDKSDSFGFKIVNKKATLDFSMFQAVSDITTFLFDILFVLTLALITRNLIRG